MLTKYFLFNSVKSHGEVKVGVTKKNQLDRQHVREFPAMPSIEREENAFEKIEMAGNFSALYSVVWLRRRL